MYVVIRMYMQKERQPVEEVKIKAVSYFLNISIGPTTVKVQSQLHRGGGPAVFSLSR